MEGHDPLETASWGEFCIDSLDSVTSTRISETVHNPSIYGPLNGPPKDRRSEMGR